MTGPQPIGIICTDRGQHDPAMISAVDDKGMTYAAEWWMPPHLPDDDDDAEYVASLHPTAYQFRCPRCPGHVRIRRDRWWKIVDGARKSGLTFLDVSRLT